MFRVRCASMLAILLTGVVSPTLFAAELLDIPGEGDLRCFPRETCVDSRGTVTSIPSGLVSGSLLGPSPTLAVSLTTSPVFLTFSGGNIPLGPLGLNPAYQPETIRDSRIPAAGQQLTLDLTNATTSVLSSIALYLEIEPTVITGPFPAQGDGLSFGVFCNTGLEEPRNCAENIALLSTPTGPGMLNPADITPAVGPGTTFGDLLRFSNVNLAPGESGRFTFFITDRKATLDPSTGGPVQGATPSFNLEIVATAIPEPGTSLMGGAGLLALLLARRSRRRQNQFVRNPSRCSSLL